MPFGSLNPFDENGLFRLAGVPGEFRRRAVRSAGVTVASQAGVFAVQMISTVVLARLLTPADFGVVTMVTTFSLLIMSFGLNGYTEGILQRRDLDHFLASNLFWINFGVGLLSAIAFAGVGPILAEFYRDGRLTRITVGLSLPILISGTSVVHLALLKRGLRFTATSANEVLSTLASVVISVLFAWKGWGYWALIVGLVTRSLVQAAGAWWLCRWMPALPRRAPGTGEVARFAAHVFGRYCLNYGTRNTDNLLVGWRFGSGPLGFYKKAYDLFLLPANQLLVPVADVVLSTLGRLEGGSAQYRRYFLNGLSILAFIGMGAGAVLTLVGRDLIRVLLGPQWGPAGEIFTFFGPGIGIMLIYGTHGLLHLSLGRADRWLRWVVVELIVTGLLFLLGLHWGPVGVAAAWTTSFWILTIPGFWYAGRPINFGIKPMVDAVWKYVVAALLAGCGTAAIVRSIVPLAGSTVFAALGRIVSITLLTSVLYLLAVILLHGGMAPLLAFSRLIPDLLSARRSANTSVSDVAVPASQGS
jgi:O-antigen/teichoic acid export membrane protein